MELDGRVCNHCKIEKKRECFFKHKRNKGNMYSFCIDCVKIKRKEYYDKNRKKLLKKQRSKRTTREYKDKVNIKMKEYRKNNPLKMLVRWARGKCKKYGLPFNLKETDLEYTGKCLVFGTELKVGDENLDNSPTLDRIIPELGYIKGNVQIISHLANRIKNNSTIEQLEQVVSYVKKYKGENDGNN